MWIRWAVYVAGMWDEKRANKFWLDILKVRPLGSPKRRREDNIKWILSK